MKQKQLVATEVTYRAAGVLRAVNHDLRREILALLDGKGKLSVTEIWAALGIEQSVCSSQLTILREAGVIGVERAAKNKYYFLDRKRLQEINDFSKALIK